MIRSFPNESRKEAWQQCKLPGTGGNVCKRLHDTTEILEEKKLGGWDKIRSSETS